MPRDSTPAPVHGSRLPIAYSSRRGSGTAPPGSPSTRAATPALGLQQGVRADRVQRSRAGTVRSEPAGRRDRLSAFGLEAMVGSGVSGALTKETNRRSRSGLSMVAFHSSTYPADVAGHRGVRSAQMPSESSTITARRCSSPPSIPSIQADGALQPVGGTDVEHQEPVDQPDQLLGSQVAGEQVGVPGPEPAVAAHVEVPAPVGGDDAEVLAARLGALPGAARHRRLQLVRRRAALVPQLQRDRQADRVLHAVPAPGGRRRTTSPYAAPSRRRARTRSRRRPAGARSPAAARPGPRAGRCAARR